MNGLCGLFTLTLPNNTMALVAGAVGAATLWLSHNGIIGNSIVLLWLHEWPVTLGLIVPEKEETNNDGNPVHVV